MGYRDRNAPLFFQKLHHSLTPLVSVQRATPSKSIEPGQAGLHQPHAPAIQKFFTSSVRASAALISGKQSSRLRLAIRARFSSPALPAAQAPFLDLQIITGNCKLHNKTIPSQAVVSNAGSNS